jgi:hypothetical protein
MKLYNRLCASLIAVLAVSSQSVITTPAYVLPQHSMDSHHSSDQSKAASLKFLFDNLSADDLKNRCHASQIDLNRDGRKEISIRRIDSLCGGSGRCSISINKQQNSGYQTILRGVATSPDFVVLSSQTNGWRDIATRSYLGKEFWAVWKFDGKEYQVVAQKDIRSIPNSKITKSKPCSKIFSSE